MRRHTFWSTVYRVLIVVEIVCVFSLPLLAALLKCDPADWGIRLGEIIRYFQRSAWIWLIALSLLLAVSKVLRVVVGPPWVWSAIQRLLDSFRREVFSVGEQDGVHEERITLFMRSRFLIRIHPWRSPFWPWGWPRVPWSGWLVPVVRSGHTTQKTDTVFLAPDDADNAEGVAGKAWACMSCISIDQLPQIGVDASSDEIAEYARKAFMDVETLRLRVKQGKACPRTLYAVPVEVNNRVWGVLVLDSRKEKAIKQGGMGWKAFEKSCAMLLSELLRKRV